jgi:hypothetical protein
MLWRWVLSYVQVAEQLFELIRLIDVVIIGQHRKEQTFTEFARTCEEKVFISFFLQQFNKPGFVDIDIILGSYTFKI